MQSVFDSTKRLARNFLRSVGPDSAWWQGLRGERPRIAPTPRRTVYEEGTAKLYAFYPPEGIAPAARLPVLLVPSLINRWYVFDLYPGGSLVEALVRAGLTTYCLDWGTPRAPDRHLDWDDLVDRLGRAVRRVQRETGAPQTGLLGYSMGATLAGVYAALEPDRVAAFVNLAGPFDFAKAGPIKTLTDPRWFNPEALTASGNVRPEMLLSAFLLLHPTFYASNRAMLLARGHRPAVFDAIVALERWAFDGVPFPAAAYRTFVRELCQQNALVRGTHHVRGRRVDLANLRAPLLSVVADRETICPREAVCALNEHAGSADKELLVIRGGHVSAVTGPKAASTAYPPITQWLTQRLGPTALS